MFIIRNCTFGHEEIVNKEINFGRHKVDIKAFDQVDLSDAAIPEMQEELKTLDEAAVHALTKKTALKDFVLKTKDSTGEIQYFLIHCYGKDATKFLGTDHRSYRLFYDVYAISEDGDILLITQFLDQVRKYPSTTVSRQVAFKSSFLNSFFQLKKPDPVEWNRMARFAHFHYLYVLYVFTHCPERIQEKHNGERASFRVNRKPVEPLHEVEVERVIRPEPEKEPETGAVSEDVASPITCPYWTVRGHYRHYKSGKVIWIEPYAKGKDRDKPENVVSKKYLRKEKKNGSS